MEAKEAFGQTYYNLEVLLYFQNNSTNHHSLILRHQQDCGLESINSYFFNNFIVPYDFFQGSQFFNLISSTGQFSTYDMFKRAKNERKDYQ